MAESGDLAREELPLASIVADRVAIQPRIQLDEEAIEAYAEAVEKLPPVVVFRDPESGRSWLADGFHRLEAHIRARRDAARHRWHGSARQGAARQGKASLAWRGRAWPGKAGWRSTLKAGEGSTLTAGEGSVFIFRWLDTKTHALRVAVAAVGEGGIQPDTPYRCDEGVWIQKGESDNG